MLSKSNVFIPLRLSVSMNSNPDRLQRTWKGLNKKHKSKITISEIVSKVCPCNGHFRTCPPPRIYKLTTCHVALEASNTRYPDDSDGQIRRSQVSKLFCSLFWLTVTHTYQSEAIRKRFMETIQKYQDVERIYKQKYRQRVERQIRIGWYRMLYP